MAKYIVTVKFEVWVVTEQDNLDDLEFELINGHHFPEKSSVISLKESLKKKKLMQDTFILLSIFRRDR